MESIRKFSVGGLGEIAIRCVRFEAMVAFYRDVIGLPVLRDTAERGIVFFRIAEGFAGHTAVLALFRPEDSAASVAAGPSSSLHHLALSTAADALPAVMDWYRANGVEFTVEDFAWAGWRGVFTRDPDGNLVEIVAKVSDGSSEGDSR